MPQRVRRPQLSEERRRGLLFIAATTAIMWISEIVDQATRANLDRFGVRPRSVDGLDGILWEPFLHGGFDHLIGNTVPYVALGAVIAMSGLARVASVFVIVALVGGLGTWLIAPGNSIHIGASGVVFGFAAYLVARWLYTHRLSHVLAAVLVVAVWGGALLGGLVPTGGVSWQGHLFGGLGGLIAEAVLDGRTASRGRGRRSRTEGAAARAQAFVR